jgi:hypothetical protein
LFAPPHNITTKALEIELSSSHFKIATKKEARLEIIHNSRRQCSWIDR